MDNLEVLKKGICQVAPGIDESKIVPEASLVKDLEIDSLAIVELAMVLEDNLNITLSEEELENIVTVGDVLNTIALKQGA